MRLFATNELAEGESLGLELEDQPDIFAVRKDGELHLYRNVCPHAQMPLNWQPNQFLDRDGEYIVCTSHGAMFEVPTGNCVAGPCAGQALEPVNFEIRDEAVWLTEQP